MDPVILYAAKPQQALETTSPAWVAVSHAYAPTWSLLTVTAMVASAEGVHVFESRDN
jgi:hypothetical protein